MTSINDAFVTAQRLYMVHVIRMEVACSVDDFDISGRENYDIYLDISFQLLQIDSSINWISHLFR